MKLEYYGYLAAFLTTSSFLPQVLHALRTRDLSSISLSMYLMFVSGVALWLAYGILLGAGPLIASNAMTLLLSSIILGLKLREEMRRRAGSAPSKEAVVKGDR
ncbi:SemiSWEET transporter [Pseudogulbenkiania subflava]|uniref:MtN3 and saliva related transmembrane protein n=1 Tax=Pseudogulbenkiania subflava DSM 22618 TaxID=1123014 RepID=A0A1Y6C070_9NEIS|nr:SemiSWEET transporter [Pseudogulbenkiania subflava]SMF38804.1 MtN3 and saliva related transmembrane protein [Pseudogulbenkiania subflava DSM 22618]